MANGNVANGSKLTAKVVTKRLKDNKVKVLQNLKRLTTFSNYKEPKYLVLSRSFSFSLILKDQKRSYLDFLLHHILSCPRYECLSVSHFCDLIGRPAALWWCEVSHRKHSRSVLEGVGQARHASVIREACVAVARRQRRVEEGLLRGVVRLGLILLRLS